MEKLLEKHGISLDLHKTVKDFIKLQIELNMFRGEKDQSDMAAEILIMVRDSGEQTTDNATAILPDVTHRYHFFYDGEESGFTFDIIAKDHNDAYNKAYKKYGPQVEDMLYKQL